jgi:hypothetical protein
MQDGPDFQHHFFPLGLLFLAGQKILDAGIERA